MEEFRDLRGLPLLVGAEVGKRDHGGKEHETAREQGWQHHGTT